MTCGVAQALRLGMRARGLRLHRQHLGIHGRLRQRRRPRAHHLHPARQHRLTASWRRRSNTARARSRWRPTSTRSWRWCACSPNGSASTCSTRSIRSASKGQKTIMVEMMDQRDWRVPDWVVLPGGNLGNTSAFGKALRELRDWGLIRRLPRLAVIQAEGAAPFYDCSCTDRAPFQRRRASGNAGHRHQDRRSGLLAQGAARSARIRRRGGEGDRAGDRRRQGRIGRCGIGCEPASAATLAGIRKLTAAGVIRRMPTWSPCSPATC